MAQGFGLFKVSGSGVLGFRLYGVEGVSESEGCKPRKPKP